MFKYVKSFLSMGIVTDESRARNENLMDRLCAECTFAQ